MKEQNFLIEAFDKTFKFQQGQELRHKGDSKGSIADMGLLVVGRFLIERLGDDDERIYERHYHCRMVRFSNSGDINTFSEKELISVEEYNSKKEADEMRMDLDKFEQEEKKREFERCLAEATDFLKANGYEVVPATEIKQMHSRIKLDAEIMRSAFIMTKDTRIWRDEDMIAFAKIIFFRGPNEAKKLLEEYHEHLKNRKS